MQLPFVQVLSIFALRVVIAIAVMLAGRYLAGKARDLTKKTLKRPEVDEALSSSIESILVRLAYYGTLLVAAIFALVILGVPAGAILSVSSVALVILAVALRESLSNFAAAVIFMIYQPFRLGEEIETMGHRGIVREIQLFNTVVRQSDRSLAILPNGDIQKSGLVNFTRLGISRVDLPFTLKYSEDIEKARAVVMDIMTSDPPRDERPPARGGSQANGRQWPRDAGTDVCAVRGLRSGPVQLLAIDYGEVNCGGHRTGGYATEYPYGGTGMTNRCAK